MTADGREASSATDALLRRRHVYGLATLLLFLSHVPLICLVALWPEQDDLVGPSRFRLLEWTWTIAPERRILLCVAFCGLLGGSIRMLLRIREQFISHHVVARYIPWYFLTPPIGAILAVGFYLVVRGGFFASGSVENVNVSAFGGTGVLVGLYAEVATARLEGAFSSIFPDRSRPEESSGRREANHRVTQRQDQDRSSAAIGASPRCTAGPTGRSLTLLTGSGHPNSRILGTRGQLK